MNKLQEQHLIIKWANPGSFFFIFYFLTVNGKYLHVLYEI